MVLLEKYFTYLERTIIFMVWELFQQHMPTLLFQNNLFSPSCFTYWRETLRSSQAVGKDWCLCRLRQKPCPAPGLEGHLLFSKHIWKIPARFACPSFQFWFVPPGFLPDVASFSQILLSAFHLGSTQKVSSRLPTALILFLEALLLLSENNRSWSELNAKESKLLAQMRTF